MGANQATIQAAVLSTEEAAAYINRSVGFVRRVLRHEVPVVQHGERQPCFYYRQDLDVWLARNTHEPIR